MTDKELLTLAAKAAGATWIDICWPEELQGLMLDFGKGTTQWNPLESSSDAFELAGKLQMYQRTYEDYVLAGNSPSDEWRQGIENFDYCKAMRIAIVRSAASIGKRKE